MLKITEDKFNDAKTFFSKLDLYFFSLISVPLIVFIVAYIKSYSLVDFEKSGNSLMYNWGVLGSSIVAIMLFYIVFRRGLTAIGNNKTLTLKQRFVAYSAVCLRLYVMFFILSSVAVVCFVMTANQIFLIMYCLCLVFSSVNKPSVHKVHRHLRLAQESKEKVTKNLPLDA